MNITPQQARAAFYQAAANIEARPELYNFMAIRVGEGDCPACMWGHVARVLGMDANMYVCTDVPPLLGFDHDNLTTDHPASQAIFEYFYDRMKVLEYNTLNNYECAVYRLRAFADHHWPAESTEPVRPDLVECGQSFVELMRSLGSEVQA